MDPDPNLTQLPGCKETELGRDVTRPGRVELDVPAVHGKYPLRYK